MALSIPAILTGAGSGFLLAGPVGAVIGAGGGAILGRRVVPAEAVVTPAGPGILVQDDALQPDPTSIPTSTQASADIVNNIVTLDTLAPDAVDYQPYPPRYLWNQSDAALSSFGISTWDQLKGELPMLAIGIASLAGLAFLYFSSGTPRR